MMNKYFVEFLGTLFLVFVIFATGNYLAIGAALAVAILLGSAISGGAFNPAVSNIIDFEDIPDNLSFDKVFSLDDELESIGLLKKLNFNFYLISL